MKYSDYSFIQLNTASSSISDSIDFFQNHITGFRKNRSSEEMYTESEITEILNHCEELILAVPEAAKDWSQENKAKLCAFLHTLKKGDFKTPKEYFTAGKSRGYNSHLTWFSSFLKDNDSVVIDIAGRSGYASSALKHLGFPKSCTIEFSPLNVIIGRYIWGHKDIYQGDVHFLRRAKCPFTDLSKAESVDGFFCRYALEHFLDLKKFFEEITFLLKPGGVVGFIVGQSFNKAISEGDVNYFPDALSIYEKAPHLVMTDYKFQKIEGGNVWEHLVLLTKPADPTLLTPAKLKKTFKKQVKSLIKKAIGRD